MENINSLLCTSMENILDIDFDAELNTGAIKEDIFAQDKLMMNNCDHITVIKKNDMIRFLNILNSTAFWKMLCGASDIKRLNMVVVSLLLEMVTKWSENDVQSEHLLGFLDSMVGIEEMIQHNKCKYLGPKIK